MQQPISKTLNFKQAGEFYRALSDKEKNDLVYNLQQNLGKVQNQEVKYTMLSYFYKADKNYGDRVTKAIGCDPKVVHQMAAKLSE